MYEHETAPTPPKNNPFPGLILKVGKMNYCLGKMDPIWAKCLKSGQNFSRSGQKKIIHALPPPFFYETKAGQLEASTVNWKILFGNISETM